MIFFFLIIISFHLFIPFLSEQSDRKKHICLLPFVTKPCINDGQNLSCTFSLNSSERKKTCDLTSISLIFTTTHVELFIIPQYYNQLIPTDKYIITKLIIEPNILNHTYEYLHWPDLRILSIEIPIDVDEFIIIHDKNNLDITRIRNNLNDSEYWHLQIWPTKSGKCEITVLTRHNITTTLYDCPYHINYDKPDLCGLRYACLDNNPCYATGYRQVVCRANQIHSRARFEALYNIPQYETIFVNILHGSSSNLHEIDQKIFVVDNNATKPIFITKRLVVVIGTGILRISSKLFDNSENFQVRIEHGECDERQFLLDILNDNELSLTHNFVDYTSSQTGTIGCWLNRNKTTIIDRFRPYLSLSNISIAHVGQQIALYYFIGGLPPFNITYLRNNTTMTIQESTDPIFLGSYDNQFIATLEFDIATKDDNGIKYQIIASNSFGKDIATTQLDVTYEPFFIISLQNQTVKKDSNITLEAKIDGNPSPDVYIHYSNFYERLYPTNNDSFLYQYNLYNVQLNDSDSYTFFVTSEAYRTNISETIFLTIFGPLYAINPIYNISIEEDEKLNLTILFSHSIIKTQWFVNDTLIENTSIPYIYYIINDQAVLIINQIPIKYNGQYKVQVWDILNQTNQSLTIIHIYSILPIILYCNHRTIPEQLYTYIICRSQAKHPQIQWIDPNGQIILNQSNYEYINDSVDIFDAKLVFRKILYKHFGIYTFQVNNNGGNAIYKIDITLKDISPIIGYNNFQSKKMYMNIGDTYSFILHFNGIPWPNITFFFNNKVLLFYSVSYASPISLTLKNLSVINEGIYYARVMNNKGSVETNRTEICIIQSPSFIIENSQSLSSIISVKPNQSITLITPKIKVGSLDPLKIVWYIKEKSLKLPFNSSILYSQITINTSLQQEQIACIIENKFGESAYFFKLNFLQPPRFNRALEKSIEVKLHENVILTINVTSNPLSIIQWLYNKQIINNKQFEQYITNDYGIYSLILRNFTREDIGNYSVIIQNSEDKITSETQITIKSMKFHINTLSSTEIMKLFTKLTNIKRRTSICNENIIHMMIILLMIILIIIVCISIFYKQNRLSTLFNC